MAACRVITETFSSNTIFVTQCTHRSGNERPVTNQAEHHVNRDSPVKLIIILLLNIPFVLMGKMIVPVYLLSASFSLCSVQTAGTRVTSRLFNSRH